MWTTGGRVASEEIYFVYGFLQWSFFTKMWIASCRASLAAKDMLAKTTMVVYVERCRLREEGAHRRVTWRSMVTPWIVALWLAKTDTTVTIWIATSLRCGFAPLQGLSTHWVFCFISCRASLAAKDWHKIPQ